MKAITFSLQTIQPILATSFQGDPNSDVSYPYIPGSMIRGVLIGRYLKRHHLQDVDILADERSRGLFFNGTTRYLNAYLRSQNGQRTVPMLLSWKKEKGDELTDKVDNINVYDFSVDQPDEDKLQHPQAIGESFWVEEKGYVRLYTVNRRINIHNFRDRTKGRSTKTEGELFCYDAIDAGQWFQGVILCQDTEEQTVRELLEPTDAWLGGSRSAGYGHVKIQITDPILSESWREVGSFSPAETRTDLNCLKITLLSDLIVRDQWGQYVAAPPTRLLAQVLGQDVPEPKIAYMNRVFIGGFNRKWGLPLPQMPAVKAGSVFVYENVNITPDKICQLEAEGIGERRVEGFGRIAVNWRLKEREFIVKKPESKPPSRRDKPQLKYHESRILARQMAERVLRQKLEQLLLEQVNSYKLEANPMTNSQLSRLMIVTRQALDENSRQPLDILFSQLPAKAREQYERTQLNQTIHRLLTGEWLKHYIQPVAIADEPATLTDELAMEYSLRLILAIAKNAIKEKANEQ